MNLMLIKLKRKKLKIKVRKKERHQKNNWCLFRYDLGTMSLNKVSKLRKHHQFIGVFSTKKGTFDHKSTNQPKPPEESPCGSHFLFKPSICKGL